MIQLLIISFIFLLGLYSYMKYKSTINEPFSLDLEKQCYDVLVQEGKLFFLHNTKIAEVPGLNPVIFQNLDEYVDYMRWQRSQDIRCPVLFLQKSMSANGDTEWVQRKGPMDLQPGANPRPKSDSPHTNVINNIPNSIQNSDGMSITKHQIDTVKNFHKKSFEESYKDRQLNMNDLLKNTPYVSEGTDVTSYNHASYDKGKDKDSNLDNVNAMKKKWKGPDYSRNYMKKYNIERKKKAAELNVTKYEEKKSSDDYDAYLDKIKN